MGLRPFESSESYEDLLVTSACLYLTQQESRVFELIARGLSSQQVRARLNMSRQAVDYHVGNLISKFGAQNRTGAVSRGFVLGFLTADKWPPQVSNGHQAS